MFAAGAAGALPDLGRPYIASIVGRIAAPKGVDMKSVGRSIQRGKLIKYHLVTLFNDAPLIKAGIVPPVKNPIQSFVNELQLKSKKTHHEKNTHRS